MGYNGYVTNPPRYYHVRLFYYVENQPPKIDHTDRINLLKTEMVKEILEPYGGKKPFSFEGTIVQPNDVADIQISATPSRISDITPAMYDFPFGGTDVTDRFLRKAKKTDIEDRVDILSKNVFIVHGREHKPMKELKALLNKLGFNPIVLHEQASGGSSTLPEKLERYGRDIGYAFVILTPEDVGGNRDEVRRRLGADKPLLQRTAVLVGLDIADHILKKFETRARQNVIFEMGYFWGLLKRKRVCCLIKGNVKKPSDIEGIVYVPFNKSISEVKDRIVEELREAGYEIK